MLVVKHKRIFYQFYCGHQPTWARSIVRCVPRDWLQVKNSKRKGSVAVRINVKNDDFDRVSENNFWPKYVYCRPWFSRQNWINSS